VGQYKSTPCTGEESVSMVGCLPCSDCERGKYITEPCDGNGESATGAVCSTCGMCAQGYYITGCDGDTVTNDKVKQSPLKFRVWV
jgi:hypothetical protein